MSRVALSAAMASGCSMANTRSSKTYHRASIPTRMDGIALRNGCEPEPTVEAIGDELERWTWDCPSGAEVELVTHDGGYEWPTR